MQQQQRQPETRAQETTTAYPSLAEVATATELKFSQEERSIIRESFAAGASEAEFRQLMAIAEQRGLSPLKGQCHFVKRWSEQRRETWAVQVSIDGMRGQAESTGLYDGQDEPEFSQDGSELICRVRVYRKDWSRPAVGVAYLSEFVQKTKEGKPTRMWANMPHIMLAKCAESQAMRKAFPVRLGGLYSDDEMAQASHAERPSAPAADSQPSSPGATSAPVCPYGRLKGQLLSAISDKNLVELGQAVQKAIDDPARAKSKAANKRLLAQIAEELDGRGGEPEPVGAATEEPQHDPDTGEVPADGWPEGRE